jgi:small subunit ribosomal protein S18
VAEREYQSKEDREGGMGFRGRRGTCRFMKEGKCQVDYKDTRMLAKLVTPQGKLFSRKRSGACAYCQRRIQIAVKRARLLALLPFVGR